MAAAHLASPDGDAALAALVPLCLAQAKKDAAWKPLARLALTARTPAERKALLAEYQSRRLAEKPDAKA